MDFEKLKLFASASGLDGAASLWRTPDADIICNGIGASYFPDRLRKLLDRCNPAIQAPAAIHDLDYTRGGSVADRLRADRKFLKNCFRAGNYLYNVCDFRRYFVWAKGVKFYILLRLGGGAAFNYHGGATS